MQAMTEVRAPAGELLDVNALRARVSELMNRFGTKLNHLGQIAAGLAVVDPESLPARGAGYGSKVTARNVETGERHQYTLMVGSLIDIEADQVSLASPIGQALLGTVEGDEITIRTPNKQSRLVVTKVVSLIDLLADDTLGNGA